MSYVWILGALLACGGQKTGGGGSDSGLAETGQPGGETGQPGDSDSGGGGDSGHTGESGDTSVADLYGTAPETSFPPPEFSATNRDESPRGPEDLVGRPTVMWFYPAATTSG